MDDLFYRYIITSPEIKYELNFTIIRNLNKISKDLYMPNIVIIKYLSHKLSCSYKIFNNYKPICYGLRGNFTKDNLIQLFSDFQKKYCNCKECNNPEIIFTLKKNKLVSNCKSCGLFKTYGKSNDKVYSSLRLYLSTN